MGTIYLTSTLELATRGGQVTTDSDFMVVVSTCCGRHWLYDEEVLRLFVDPTDLTKSFLNIEGEAPDNCPSCGAADWNLGEALSDVGDIRRGPWSWAM